MNQHRNQRGFTLLELMIAVVVVAILASVAYPSYQAHLRKSRRAEAQQVLMDLAARQQQYFLDTRTYGSTTAIIGGTEPASAQAYYTFAWSLGGSTAPTAFTVTAVPISGKSQAQDSCNNLSVNEAGVRAPTGCW